MFNPGHPRKDDVFLATAPQATCWPWPGCGAPPLLQRLGEWKRWKRCLIVDRWFIPCLWMVDTLSGWWFGTFFIFPYIGNNHPNWLIFFRGVAQPPTSYKSWDKTGCQPIYPMFFFRVSTEVFSWTQWFMPLFILVYRVSTMCPIDRWSIRLFVGFPFFLGIQHVLSIQDIYLKPEVCPTIGFQDVQDVSTVQDIQKWCRISQPSTVSLDWSLGKPSGNYSFCHGKQGGALWVFPSTNPMNIPPKSW